MPFDPYFLERDIKDLQTVVDALRRSAKATAEENRRVLAEHRSMICQLQRMLVRGSLALPTDFEEEE